MFKVKNLSLITNFFYFINSYFFCKKSIKKNREKNSVFRGNSKFKKRKTLMTPNWISHT